MNSTVQEIGRGTKHSLCTISYRRAVKNIFYFCFRIHFDA